MVGRGRVGSIVKEILSERIILGIVLLVSIGRLHAQEFELELGDVQVFNEAELEIENIEENTSDVEGIAEEVNNSHIEFTGKSIYEGLAFGETQGVGGYGEVHIEMDFDKDVITGEIAKIGPAMDPQGSGLTSLDKDGLILKWEGDGTDAEPGYQGDMEAFKRDYPVRPANPDDGQGNATPEEELIYMDLVAVEAVDVKNWKKPIPMLALEGFNWVSDVMAGEFIFGEDRGDRELHYEGNMRHLELSEDRGFVEGFWGLTNMYVQLEDGDINEDGTMNLDGVTNRDMFNKLYPGSDDGSFVEVENVEYTDPVTNEVIQTEAVQLSASSNSSVTQDGYYQYIETKTEDGYTVSHGDLLVGATSLGTNPTDIINIDAETGRYDVGFRLDGSLEADFIENISGGNNGGIGS